MQIISNSQQLQQLMFNLKAQGKFIGLVPTMGYLHAGHESLINLARANNDIVVVSIFVNPLQFGKNEDLTTYPRNLTQDSNLCHKAQVDILFTPNASELTPNNMLTFINVANLDKHLCGAMRPGHFQGVCTIVSKLFNLVMPHRAYFGEKDIQQLRIIQRMTKELNFPIEIVSSPTIRNSNGLALSSRNSYLSTKEYQAAQIVPKVVNYIYHLITKDNLRLKSQILTKALDFVASQPLAKINYIEIVDNDTLQPIENLTATFIIAVAIYIGTTRLIDNRIVTLG